MAADEPVLAMGMMNEGQVMRRTGRDAISDFFRQKTLYDLMRPSGKVKDSSRADCCSGRMICPRIFSQFDTLFAFELLV
jgi:hypothetical protein